MNRYLLLISTVLFFFSHIVFYKHSASANGNTTQFKYVATEEVGLSSDKMNEAEEYAAQIGSAAVMAAIEGNS